MRRDRGPRVRRGPVPRRDRSGRGVRRRHPRTASPRRTGSRSSAPTAGAGRARRAGSRLIAGPRARRRPRPGRHLRRRRRRRASTRGSQRRRRSIAAVRRVARRSRRVASVCSRRVPARRGRPARRPPGHHPLGVAATARPRVPERSTVEPDPIFVRDGDVYTSAGVTAGIDLCLALVEEDHGRDVALAVARQLVVFLKRPGGQAQFSSHLVDPARRPRRARRGAGLDRRPSRRRPLGRRASPPGPR